MDFRNLTSYREKKLNVVDVNERTYFTDSSFNPNLIIGMAFGANYDEKSHNYKLAKAVIDSREYFGKEIPVLVQSEIGECLMRSGEKNFYFVGENYAEGESSLIKSKIDTEGIFKHCKKIIKSKGLGNKILYVAHPAHMQRVLDTAKKQGLEGIPFVSEKVEWLDDAQPWVTSPYLWVPREIVARVLK
ncbi:MAG: hypothetical protein Q8P15_01875 [Nanoarchaeota archaeon]|nr:hypothetical protein [Nanoarchaeota archaeon]